MGTENEKTVVTALGLRIRSTDSNSIMVRQYQSSDRWTLPMLNIYSDADPVNYIKRSLERIDKSKHFKLISATPLLHKIEKPNIKNKFRVCRYFIYDIEYDGYVYITLPDDIATHVYSKMRWIDQLKLGTLGSLNKLTLMYHHMLQKEHEANSK